MKKNSLLLLASLLVAAACGGAQPEPTPPTSPTGTAIGTTAPTSPTGTPTAPSVSAGDAGATTAPPTQPSNAKTKTITATEMGPALKELGLDVKSLPPLNKIPPDKIRKVMNTFTKALGTQCTGCHDGDDFKKATPNKKVAARMWNEFVRGYAFAGEGGGAVYCDSCHGGKMTFLVRDPGLKELSKWMDENMVGKLKKPNGQAHSCETCHGDPIEGKFLHNWKK